MKVCTKCGRELPEEMFHKNKATKDGLQTQCKECRCDHQKGYREEHKEEIREYNEKYKEEHKEERKKYYQEHRKERLEYGKTYKAKHKEEIKEYDKKYYQEHKEEIREYMKKYQKTLRGKAATKAANHNQRVKKKNNGVKKKNNGGSFTVDEWIALCAEFNNRCAYCGSEVPFIEALSADHVVPIVDGGRNDINNIVPACMYCNLTKNRKTLTDWYPAQSFFTAERYQKIIEHAHLK